jgi:hypothetical protein
MTTEARDRLVRETFELDRDIAFFTFRRLYIEKPEIVQACPDPQVREKMLRGFWNQDAEPRFAEFQGNVSHMSVEQLQTLKAGWLDELHALQIQQIVGGDCRMEETPHEQDMTQERSRKR